jgi:hypothetical protein
MPSGDWVIFEYTLSIGCRRGRDGIYECKDPGLWLRELRDQGTEVESAVWIPSIASSAFYLTRGPGMPSIINQPLAAVKSFTMIALRASAFTPEVDRCAGEPASR